MSDGLLVPLRRGKRSRTSLNVFKDNEARELVFAVVGHIGSGTSEIANALVSDLERLEECYETTLLKARQSIVDWANARGLSGSQSSGQIADVQHLQDMGDRARLESEDNAFVARELIKRIRLTRAEKMNKTAGPGDVVEPDGKKRAYVLDSIRHPDEVKLLRAVYGPAFSLIGVVCEEDTRRQRLQRKFGDCGESRANELMARDAKSEKKHGQRVSDTFHLADFFVDNTQSRYLDESWKRSK
jgi:hypothetical protein